MYVHTHIFIVLFKLYGRNFSNEREKENKRKTMTLIKNNMNSNYNPSVYGT